MDAWPASAVCCLSGSCLLWGCHPPIPPLHWYQHEPRSVLRHKPCSHTQGTWRPHVGRQLLAGDQLQSCHWLTGCLGRRLVLPASGPAGAARSRLQRALCQGVPHSCACRHHGRPVCTNHCRAHRAESSSLGRALACRWQLAAERVQQPPRAPAARPCTIPIDPQAVSG